MIARAAHLAQIGELPVGEALSIGLRAIQQPRDSGCGQKGVMLGFKRRALFAAQIASDLGADVAVVPGRVTDPGGRWTLALLRDGAHPVGCAGDVLELIGDGVQVPRVAA